MGDPDFCIVGFGIAGATLALALDRHDARLRICDANLDGASSRVAAGLITPVTGKNLKPQSDFELLRQKAVDVYRSLEKETGKRFFFERSALRVLSEHKEISAYEKANADSLLRRYLRPTSFGTWPGVRDTGMPMEMVRAARLDTQTFLAAARHYLEAKHTFAGDVVETSNVPTVWCCGYREYETNRVPLLTWRPAKGEILKLDIDSQPFAGTVHANGLWITPTAGTTALAGATYSWDVLDGTPTQSARASLVERLHLTLSSNFRVLDHFAGVRPIVAGRKPVIGPVDASPSQWLFNGLGSKGALFAPSVAQQLADHLVNGASISSDYELKQRTSPP